MADNKEPKDYSFIKLTPLEQEILNKDKENSVATPAQGATSNGVNTTPSATTTTPSTYGTSTTTATSSGASESVAAGVAGTIAKQVVKKAFPIKKLIIAICSLFICAGGAVGGVLFMLNSGGEPVLAQINVAVMYINEHYNIQNTVSVDEFKYTESSESQTQSSTPVSQDISPSTYVKMVYNLYNYSSSSYLYRFDFTSLQFDNCKLTFKERTGEERVIQQGNTLDIILTSNRSETVEIFIRIDSVINDSFCNGDILLNLSLI